MTASPRAAVRAELRGVLHDLSDALLDGASAAYLHEVIRHAWLLADLAGIDLERVYLVLGTLQAELEELGVVDARHFAQQLTLAADRL